ncbi:enoyl-CoA hydratase/isomerase family protein [Arthrobacter sp. H14-L1]|uniref:enoyl-CoA hydratase/isomerase family protein n=1 Tax=Arthrobacter sp. H14-L1 TaxID=2996697 RepID=UPI0022701EE3|nr:enoyl-CoA hydratase/isomerase family protein [Arthrobacter sp. H14-L1]MCY0906178.1 enoyl-CoA hydratase/isomerase family protein [Arthrobacter sp. H14-L1]
MTAAAGQKLDLPLIPAPGRVAVLEVGTGERFNALASAQWQVLERSARTLAADPCVRAVVLRGAGGTFCSGSDLREWQHGTGADVSAAFCAIEAALQALEAIPVPTVALVQGVATGAGCQLALACDLQVLEATSLIGMPIARLGMLIPPTFANRMSLRIGPSRTKDLLYGGRLLTAKEALDMGLVTTVTETGRAWEEVQQITTRWSTLSQASLKASKTAVNQGLAPLDNPARALPQGPAADTKEFFSRVNDFLNRKRQTTHR